MHIYLSKLLLYLTSFLCLSPVTAQVIFDSSFHNDGRVTFQNNLSATQPYSHTVLSDGTVLAAGNLPGSFYSGYLFRFQPDGSHGGDLTMSNCMDKMVIYRMPGDTLIVAGQGWDNTFNHQSGNQMITITKRGPAGQPIASFGSGGSISFYVPLGNAWLGGYPSAVTVQPDGKIVVAITVNSFFPYSNIIRLLPDGQFDSTFGQGGVKEILLGNCGFIVNRIFTVAGGKLLFTGDYRNTNAYDQHYSAARLQPNGDYDSTYGTNGYVHTKLGTPGRVYSSVVQPDGKVVLAGSVGSGYALVYGIIRFTNTGTPDSSFGINGIVKGTTSFQYAVAMESDSQGRFCVLGTYSPNNGQTWNWYLTRLKANGATDSSFNGNAAFTLSLPLTGNEIRGMSLLPYGKILVFGYYWNSTQNYSLYLGRLLTKPWVSIGGVGPDYCTGDTANLVYYGSGQPRWYHNNTLLPDTGRFLLVKASGSYYAVSQSSYDTSNPVTLNFYPVPQPVIQVSGDSLVVAGGGNFTWYSAIDSTAIPGASGPSFRPAAGGAFFVRQTDSNGCAGYSSVVQFTPAGLDAGATVTGSVTCWPNPSAGVLFIRNDSRNTYDLQIFLVSGIVIARYELGPGLQVFDLKQLALPSGSLLILQFSSERERISRKVLVE